MKRWIAILLLVVAVIVEEVQIIHLKRSEDLLMELTGSNISLLKVSGQWTTYQEYQIDKLRFDECQMLGIITGGASGPSGTYPQCAHLEPSQDNQLSAPPPLPPGAVPIK